jgi:hypothetical protein
MKKGIVFLIISFLGFIYHKWWINEKKKKGLEIVGYDKTVRIISDWGFIILFGLLSIICFFI